MNLLAADIGGTNTRLMYASLTADGSVFQIEKNYLSADFPDFYSVLEQFFVETKLTETITAACFGVAGPVKQGVAAVTNLPWVISEAEVASRFQIKYVKLINDFIAIVYGLESLQADDVMLLQQAAGDTIKQPPDAAVIGAGTGLGVAHRVWLADHYEAFSSEAGHSGFSPQNDQQLQLLQWLQKKYANTSLEMLCSGRGLTLIYDFLAEQGEFNISDEISEAMQKKSKAEVITHNALLKRDNLCVATVNCFVEIYGAAAGNAALYYYPVGEVYIAGGIAPKIKQKLTEPRFTAAFTNKGLMSENMKNITIKLILNEKVGIQGALLVAKKLSTEQHSDRQDK